MQEVEKRWGNRVGERRNQASNATNFIVPNEKKATGKQA